MDLTYGLVLAVIALVITIIAFAKKMKKNTRMLLATIGIIGIVVGGYTLYSPGAIGFLDQTFSAGAPPTPTPTPTPGSPLVAGQCVGIEDTTVTLSAEDIYTSTATGGRHRYRLNGAPALTVSDAGTLTASPGDKIEILWYNGTLTTAGYVSDVSTETVPCAGTKTFSKKLYANGTITIDVFNEEGNLVDTDAGGTENETIGAGDVVTLEARLKGTFEKAMPYGGVMVIEFNSTAYDDVIFKFEGSEKTSTPSFYNVYSLSGVAHTTRAYTVRPILGSEILYGTIVIDTADNTNSNPNGANQSTGDAWINLTLYEYNYFVNQDRGGSFDGPAIEDEDRNVLGGKHTGGISVD